MRFDKDKVKTVLQKHWKRWFFGIVLPILLITFLSILQSVLMNFPSVGEAYAKSGFVFFSFIPAKISDLVPISLAEIFVVTLILSSPILIALLVIRIRRAVKAGRGKKYFYNVGRVVAWGLFVIYFLFMLLHGLNYTRYSLDEELGFGKRTYTLEELQEVYAWVISSINETRPQCTEDENGVLSESELQARVEIEYDRINELNSFCEDNKVVAPCYYLVLFESDKRQLDIQIRDAEQLRVVRRDETDAAGCLVQMPIQPIPNVAVTVEIVLAGIRV